MYHAQGMIQITKYKETERIKNRLPRPGIERTNIGRFDRESIDSRSRRPIFARSISLYLINCVCLAQN